MNFVLSEAVSSTAKKSSPKKYKCPYCDNRFERAKLHIHIQNEHADLIPEGYTALRVAFNTINNKTSGHCIMCGKNTDWNEDKGRYERLCNDPACHEAYKKMAAERTKRIYGTERLQSDPRYAEEVQKKALAGRGMSGFYKFPDGGVIQYFGSYEKKLLEFMDKVMNCKSEDITSPGPGIEYKYEDKIHLYLPDFYYIPYNLLIEIKDGGENPNNHPNRIGRDEEKLKAKELAVAKLKKYNYLRLVNNEFNQLLQIMSVLKFQLQEENYDPIMKINESTFNEDMSGTIAAALPLTPSPTPHECDKDNYYMVQHLQNNTFSYGITKDQTQYTIYSVDPEDKNFYKVYKTDKGSIDKKYLTFKIKDKQTAKELYDELATIEKSSNKKIIVSETFADYIYRRLTSGSKIISEDQLLFDSRFELVNDFDTQINEDCKILYKYLKADPLTLLEEQIEDIEHYIQSPDNDYNELIPEEVNTLQKLIEWKNIFDGMTYYQRMMSNNMSIEAYGYDNITRYNQLYSKLIQHVDPSTNKISDDVNNLHNDILNFQKQLDMIEESDTIQDGIQTKYEITDPQLEKVRIAERDGLIIMVDADHGSSYEYTTDDIAFYRKKWEKYQSLPEDKRILSNQTASDIFGINNDVLYSRIMSIYLSKFEDHSKDIYYSDININNLTSEPMPYYSPENNQNYQDLKEYDIFDHDNKFSKVKYFHLLEQLSVKLENTWNHEKRELIKDDLYNLGWNPEIPFTMESAMKLWIRHTNLSSQIQPLDEMQQATSKVPSNLSPDQLKDRIVPVYVCLLHGNKLHSKAIQWFTDSEWSHASMSFDPSLNTLYSYTTNIKNAPKKSHKTGFVIESKGKYLEDNPDARVKVYALFVRPDQKEEMMKAIQWFIDNYEDTAYSFETIFNIVRRKATKKSGDICKMVCSQFVYTILKIANLRLRKTKDSSLISPADIDELTNDSRFYAVYQGELNKYNQRTVEKLCYDLLPTLPLEYYNIDTESMNEQTLNDINIKKFNLIYEMAQMLK